MTDTSIAIVTGGVQGLGASITKVLLNRGCSVIVADIQEENGKQFANELEKIYGKGKVSFFPCDVTKLEDYQSLFEYTLKEFKKVDILVNNAGIICEQNPQALMSVNVIGPINGCLIALKYMGKSNGGKGGIVVNTASIAGFVTHPAFPLYCASKHAVIGLTRGYGHPYYYEKEGILFSALCPSYIDTDLLQDLNENSRIEGIDFVKRPNRLSPDEVALGVIRLIDDRINGSTLVVTKNEGFFYVGLQEEFKNISLE